MRFLHRVVEAVLACGALACSGTDSTSNTGPGPGGGTNISGVWNANVVVNSNGTNAPGNSCVLSGTLTIAQTGATVTGSFSGVQLCSGAANGIVTNSRDTVTGPISSGKLNGQQISFDDGLGLTYVGTLVTGDTPDRASGTATGALPMGGRPILMSGTWSLSRPSNGVDTALVDLAFDNASRQPNMTSLVVARNGVIEREAYFNGGGADVPKEIRSITKSVMSLLVGIAIDKGQISSLDQTLGQLLGSVGPSNPGMSAITVRQLLTMTSGFGGNELANPSLYDPWAAAPNQLTYLWDHPLVAAPGTQFNYYSPNYYVLSRIVTQVSGQSTYNFATSSLFTPLGITGSRNWQTDDSGYYNGGVGLSLSPKDMVAIGNLILNNGLVGTNQVINSAWIQNATDSKVATTALGAAAYETAYGYGWWRGQRYGIDYTFASGMGGQFIIVVPAKHLVVTAAANWQGVSNLNAQWQSIMDNIMLRIVPAY